MGEYAGTLTLHVGVTVDIRASLDKQDGGLGQLLVEA